MNPTMNAVTDAVGNMVVNDGLIKLKSSGYEHGKPTAGMECLCSMEDITEEAGNYCEFQSSPSMRWSPALFSSDVIRSLVLRQFEDYVTGVRKADCAADLKRRIGAFGPARTHEMRRRPPTGHALRRMGRQLRPPGVAACEQQRPTASVPARPPGQLTPASVQARVRPCTLRTSTRCRCPRATQRWYVCGSPATATSTRPSWWGRSRCAIATNTASCA